MSLQSAIVVLVALATIVAAARNVTERSLLKYDLEYPDFFLIGAMKCGTTSLSKVRLPSAQEMHAADVPRHWLIPPCTHSSFVSFCVSYSFVAHERPR